MARAALVNLGDGFAGRVAAGGGDVVFWIHGYTLDSTSWVGLWDRLPDWRHVGVDLPGHGSSLPLDDREPLPALARRIGALAMARRARHLVALSLGTILALQVALEYPGAFATLTLGAPALGGGPFDRDVWRRYAALKALFAESGYGPALRDHWMGPGASLFRGLERRPPLQQQLRGQVGRHPWWELATDSYLRLWHSPQALKELRRVGLPTLLLVGGDDAEAARQGAWLLERVIPGAERRDLPGLGHLCLLEEPAGVQPVIERHWRAHPVSAGAATARGDEHGPHD